MPILEKMSNSEENRLKYIRDTFASQSKTCGRCGGPTESIKGHKDWLWRCEKAPVCGGFKAVKRELRAAMDAMWDDLILQGK